MDDLRILAIGYYNEAIANINKNNITKAIELLMESYNIDSKNIDTNNILGLCYFKLCNFNKAIFHWKKSKSMNSEDNKAGVYLNFIKSHKVEEAIELYNNTLRMINHGNQDVALDNLLKLSLLDYGWVDIYVLSSLIYLKKGDYENSNKFIKLALNKDSGNEKANKYNIYLSEKNNAKVIERTRLGKPHKILIAALTITIITVSLSTAIILKKNYKKNDLLLRENLLVKKELQEKVSNLSKNENEIKSLEQRLNSVQLTLDNLLKEGSSNNVSSINELELLQVALKDYSNNNYKSAIDKFSLVTNNSNDNEMINEALFWIAKSYEEMEDYHMAKENYKNYVDNFSNYYYYDDSLYTLAIMLYKSGDIDEAKKYGEQLRSKCSDSIYNNKVIRDILED